MPSLNEVLIQTTQTDLMHQVTVLETSPDTGLGINDLLQSHGVDPLPKTPGNVGLCLSGGGSRALCAGLGQLRGLQALSKNGASLLSQIKAISTVSGGSWVGQTYSYLANTAVSDAAYLGSYLGPRDMTLDAISTLPVGNLGNVCNSIRFSSPGVLVEAFLLIKYHHISPNMVWQVAVAMQLLQPYGLYKTDFSTAMPTSFFTFNPASQAQIQATNPHLPETCYWVADTVDARRGKRPFPICNMSMMVSVNGKTLAAPLQSSPFFTGVLSNPNALDSNQQVVGNGAITSFAFNSSLVTRNADNTEVRQARTWTVMDMVGTSSAAIAAGLWTLVDMFKEDASALRLALENLYLHHPEHFSFLSKSPAINAANNAANNAGSEAIPKPGFLKNLEHIVEEVVHQVGVDVEEVVKNVVEVSEVVLDDAAKAILDLILNDIIEWLNHIPKSSELIPDYQYWSAKNGQALPHPLPNQFADGGFLENTGIGGMLAYDDIAAIIACINSDQPMVASKAGIFINGKNGNWLPNTNIRVDSQVAVLFGYVYDSKQEGYVLLEHNNSDDNAMQNSQLFPSECFADLLQGWWAAANQNNTISDSCISTNVAPTTFLQTLKTIENPWFKLKAGREVSVLWSYLNPVQSWFDQLPPAVQPQVKNSYPDWAKIFELGGVPAFPHFSTVFQTQLSATQFNLMSGLTAWCIADDANSAPYLALFTD
ncbi:MAG: hypothetical protein K2P84_04705 [Undibacterium sp.]|nr:hypothetical protein [Undibacterium sp.]